MDDSTTVARRGGGMKGMLAWLAILALLALVVWLVAERNSRRVLVPAMNLPLKPLMSPARTSVPSCAL